MLCNAGAERGFGAQIAIPQVGRRMARSGNNEVSPPERETSGSAKSIWSGYLDGWLAKLKPFLCVAQGRSNRIAI